MDYYDNKQNVKKKHNCAITKSKRGNEILYDKNRMKQTATDFYTKLFTSQHTDTKIQEKLLKNTRKKISQEEKENLEKLITAEEIEKAVMALQKEKSPGQDGIPI